MWAQAFGLSEAALRSLPALFGIATVPVVWAAGARLGGARVAAAAALLAAVSPFLVWHAQDARPYALVIFLTAVAFLGFVGVLQEGRGGWLALWAVASAMAIAAHYDAVFPFAVEAAWMLLAVPSRRLHVVAASGVPALAGLLLLPLARWQTGGGFAGGGVGGDAGTAGRDDPGEIAFLGIDDLQHLLDRILHLGGQFVTGYQPRAQIVTVAVGAVLLAVALGVIARTVPRDRLRRLAVPAGVGVAIVVVPVLLTLTGFDQVLTRYQAPAHVPLLLALGAGLAWANRRAAVPLLAALAVFGTAVTVVSAGDPKFGHQDWRGSLRAAGTSGEPRLLVMAAAYAYEVIPELRPGSRVIRDDPPPVREVVSIGLPAPGRRPGRSPEPPRPATPEPPRGFRVVERREADTFTLVRYRAPRATALSEAEAERLALRGPRTTLAELPPE